MSDFIYFMLLGPLLILATALFIYWLTGWQDRREERRLRSRTDRAADWGAHLNG